MTNQVQVVPVVSIVNNQTITTSQNVADVFGRRHKDILKRIENIFPDISEEVRGRNFALTSVDVQMPRGGFRKEKIYNLTREGFVLTAMGTTGHKAMQFKLAYIDAFNKMEAALTGRGRLPELPPPAPAIGAVTISDHNFKSATVRELRHRGRMLRNMGDHSFADVSGIMIAGMNKEELITRLVGDTHNDVKRRPVIRHWNSEKNIRKYAQNSGCICPFCGSEAVYGHETLYGQLNDYSLESTVQACADCKHRWVEVYNFSGIQKMS